MGVPTEPSDAPSEVSLGGQEGAPGRGHSTAEVWHEGDAHEKGTGSRGALCWPRVPARTLNFFPRVVVEAWRRGRAAGAEDR